MASNNIFGSPHQQKSGQGFCFWNMWNILSSYKIYCYHYLHAFKGESKYNTWNSWSPHYPCSYLNSELTIPVSYVHEKVTIIINFHKVSDCANFSYGLLLPCQLSALIYAMWCKVLSCCTFPAALLQQMFFKWLYPLS